MTKNANEVVGRWHCSDLFTYDRSTDSDYPATLVGSDFQDAQLELGRDGKAVLTGTGLYDFRGRWSVDGGTLRVEPEGGLFEEILRVDLGEQLSMIGQLIDDACGGEFDCYGLTFARGEAPAPAATDEEEIFRIATASYEDPNDFAAILEDAAQRDPALPRKWSKALWEAALDGRYPTREAIEADEPFPAYAQCFILSMLADDELAPTTDWVTHAHAIRGLRAFDPSKEPFEKGGALADLPPAFVDLLRALPRSEEDAKLAEHMSPAWFSYFDPAHEAFRDRPIFPQPAFDEARAKKYTE